MKDFFDTWKFKILVAVAVFLVGIMAYAGANGRLTAAPQELLGVVLMPLQKVTSALSGGIGSVWEKYTSIDEVMEQNEQLEAENAELRQQIVDYDRIKAENEAYKALANVITVGGSWMLPADALAARDWARIGDLAREAAALSR